MQAEIVWTGHRLTVLRAHLTRWIAELPAIKAVDPNRAREQGIADLKQLIESIEAEHGAYLMPAVTHSVQRPTYGLNCPVMTASRGGAEGARGLRTPPRSPSTRQLR